MEVHRNTQAKPKNTDFIDILEATSGIYASERIITISTLKPMSKHLENHQLLCKLVQYSAGKYLGLNFDPAVIVYLSQYHGKRYSRTVFENTSLLVFQSFIF